MRFRDISVKTKIVTGFCAMAGIVMTVSGLAFHSLESAHTRFKNHLSGVNHREHLAKEIRDAANSRAVAARNLVLVTDPQDRVLEHAAIATEQERMDSALQQLKQLVSARGSDQEQELVAAVEEVESRYGPFASAIVRMAEAGQREQAIAKMNHDCRPLLRELIQAVAAYNKHGVGLVEASTEQAEAEFQRHQATLIAVCVLAVGAALTLGWLLSTAITRPLRRAVDVAQAVAAGDLSSKIEVLGRDETSELLAALQQMSTSLNSVVATVRSSADGVAGASGEIAIGNQDLSARTEHQASALEETAATMQHMTATVQQNAQYARQASELSQSAANAATQGGQLVHQVVTTMSEISNASDEIRTIIHVIDGIAFQTNILALNAAVEAARAGEQGRGFAVVAEEVRALAKRSADAAKQVHELVQASLDKVHVGETLVSEAGTMMDSIVQQVQQVNGLVAEITGATSQQSNGIAEINQAVASIDQGTQQNAALVEQSAAAAESLKHQAAQLVQVLSRFRTSPAS